MKNKFIEIYRSVIIVFMFTLFGVGAIFLRYVILPFKKKKKQYETLQKTWQFFVSLLEITRVLKLNVKNKDIIENLHGKIIVSTHPSFADIILLMSVIPYSTCFVAEKLVRNPFLKGIVNLLFIPEGQKTEKWLNDAITALNFGQNVIIFPMGIRHRTNEHPRIKRGTALLALKSKTNIIMLRLTDSFDNFLQINQPIYKAGSKCVEFNLEYIGELQTKDFIEQYRDEVTFKTKVSKMIKKYLYINNE